MRTARPLVLSLAAAAASTCGGPTGPRTVGPRTLWLDAPRDGLLVLTDHQPAPF